jgi:hypothetical protein
MRRKASVGALTMEKDATDSCRCLIVSPHRKDGQHNKMQEAERDNERVPFGVVCHGGR